MIPTLSSSKTIINFYHLTQFLWVSIWEQFNWLVLAEDLLRLQSSEGCTGPRGSFSRWLTHLAGCWQNSAHCHMDLSTGLLQLSHSMFAGIPQSEWWGSKQTPQCLLCPSLRSLIPPFPQHSRSYVGQLCSMWEESAAQEMWILGGRDHRSWLSQSWKAEL